MSMPVTFLDTAFRLVFTRVDRLTEFLNMPNQVGVVYSRLNHQVELLWQHKIVEGESYFVYYRLVESIPFQGQINIRGLAVRA